MEKFKTMSVSGSEIVLSIVITFCNQDQYIEETLRSLVSLFN